MLVFYCVGSAPSPQELHRVHREARRGGRHLPPLWDRFKYPEIAVRRHFLLNGV